MPGAENKVLVIVRTGNVHNGGTDQGVYFALHGNDVISKEVKLMRPVSPYINTFEKNQFDCFIQEFEGVTSIQNMVVRTDGHRGTHIMHPEYVLYFLFFFFGLLFLIPFLFFIFVLHFRPFFGCGVFACSCGDASWCICEM